MNRSVLLQSISWIYVVGLIGCQLGCDAPANGQNDVSVSTHLPAINGHCPDIVAATRPLQRSKNASEENLKKWCRDGVATFANRVCIRYFRDFVAKTFEQTPIADELFHIETEYTDATHKLIFTRHNDHGPITKLQIIHNDGWTITWNYFPGPRNTKASIVHMENTGSINQAPDPKFCEPSEFDFGHPTTALGWLRVLNLYSGTKCEDPMFRPE